LSAKTECQRRPPGRADTDLPGLMAAKAEYEKIREVRPSRPAPQRPSRIAGARRRVRLAQREVVEPGVAEGLQVRTGRRQIP
jgi:hypothetical protein